jgi:hypothetical protein
VLPHWEEEPISLLESRVDETARPWPHTVTRPGTHFSYTFRGAHNTRTFIVHLMDRLLGWYIVNIN